MTRVARCASVALVVLIGAAASALIAFEISIMRPLLRAARATLAEAAPSEQFPPEAVARTLDVAHRGQLSLNAAGLLIGRESGKKAGFTQLQRQFAESAAGTLLPWHLSPADITTVVLARARMGNGVVGFSRASMVYLGVPLDHVNAAQAATLVAISFSPSGYLSSPERLARRVAELMAEVPR